MCLLGRDRERARAHARERLTLYEIRNEDAINKIKRRNATDNTTDTMPQNKSVAGCRGVQIWGVVVVQQQHRALHQSRLSFRDLKPHTPLRPRTDVQCVYSYNI